MAARWRRTPLLKPSRPRLDERITAALDTVIPLAVVRKPRIANETIGPIVRHLDLKFNLRLTTILLFSCAARDEVTGAHPLL